jgi:hypothetical protein
MKPSLTNFNVNLTLYEEYCNLINNYTKTSFYNFMSEGLGTTKTFGGELEMKNDKFKMSLTTLPK